MVHPAVVQAIVSDVHMSNVRGHGIHLRAEGTRCGDGRPPCRILGGSGTAGVGHGAAAKHQLNGNIGNHVGNGNTGDYNLGNGKPGNANFMAETEAHGQISSSTWVAATRQLQPG